ncbi:cytotoxic and regulatory T-cell molecule isoform X2 [Echeneis naucrates]|uniref:Ig-like domain-containing protein n=1 Tax=Echeneis naucrates TaxID=173247 RepID=A0A665TB17_ECHNA|nr:cytotoxic and regulatory T-cell molecule isoform X2 [Echeneis naucrates]
MELKLQLGVFMLIIQAALALQNVYVMKGQKLNLNCPTANAHNTSVEWKNPQGFIMFFSHKKALKDKRYTIEKLSLSEFTISITDVTFKDGGIYTCSQYDNHSTVMQVKVTVVGNPKMTKTNHDGKVAVKCTAEANHEAPRISWKLNNLPEIHNIPQVYHENQKYISTDILYMDLSEQRVTVRCLVRHPALPRALINFVKTGQDSTVHHRTTTSSPIAQPKGTLQMLGTTIGWIRHESTTTRGVNGPSSESFMKSTVPSSRPETVKDFTRYPMDPVTTTDLYLSTSEQGRTSVSMTTEEMIPSNSMESNRTESSNDTGMHTGSQRNSSILVFLVTSLIFALLVVVFFFAIKLRRAHINWKKENEDSDPSEESSKSKSSQEERNSQGQRRRGIFNTAFTKYDVEQPALVINTSAMAAAESVPKEQESQPPTSDKFDIKETEL